MGLRDNGAMKIRDNFLPGEEERFTRHLAMIARCDHMDVARAEAADLQPFWEAQYKRLLKIPVPADDAARDESITPSSVRNHFLQMAELYGNVLTNKILIIPKSFLEEKKGGDGPEKLSPEIHNDTGTKYDLLMLSNQIQDHDIGFGFLRIHKAPEPRQGNIVQSAAASAVTVSLLALEDSYLSALRNDAGRTALNHLDAVMTAANHDDLHHVTMNAINSLSFAHAMPAGLLSGKDESLPRRMIMAEWAQSVRAGPRYDRVYEFWANFSHAETWKVMTPEAQNRLHDHVKSYCDNLETVLKQCREDREATLTPGRVSGYFSDVMATALVRLVPFNHPAARHVYQWQDRHRDKRTAPFFRDSDPDVSDLCEMMDTILEHSSKRQEMLGIIQKAARKYLSGNPRSYTDRISSLFNRMIHPTGIKTVQIPDSPGDRRQIMTLIREALDYRNRGFLTNICGLFREKPLSLSDCENKLPDSENAPENFVVLMAWLVRRYMNTPARTPADKKCMISLYNRWYGDRADDSCDESEKCAIEAATDDSGALHFRQFFHMTEIALYNSYIAGVNYPDNNIRRGFHGQQDIDRLDIRMLETLRGDMNFARLHLNTPK